VWLYLRFSLSLRDVEELLAERGATVTNETIPPGARSSVRATTRGYADDVQA
jgi:transposase-like protein